ncbi:MAG: protoporphyrinogen oxidase [Chloroflexota bacterium]|nr:protoporphyrinogen oxidase [Chloroflexota bacterium]
MKKVAVVGAGIAGLSAAYFLEKRAQEAGIELAIDLIEKSGRVGGSILSEKIGDFVIEGGPDCVFSEKPAALELCEKLELESQLVKTNEEKKGTSVYSRGKLYDLPDGVILMVPTMIKPMITSGLISLRGKLRVGFDLFLPKKTDPEEESLAQFVNRRLGREMLDKIAEPLVAGIHAGDPDTMSVKASFPRFVDLEAEHRSLIKGMLSRKKQMEAVRGDKQPKYTMFMTIKDGLQVLPSSIAASLKATNIKYDFGIASLGHSTNGIEMHSEAGRGQPYDSVIVATPAYVTAEIVKGINPALASELMGIPYVSTATVSLAFAESDVGHLFNGFGFIVPKVSQRRIMAGTFTSNKFSYRAPQGACLLRAFVGGASNEALALQEDDDMIRMVLEELDAILGLRAKPLLAKVYKWKKAMPQYIVGHQDRLDRIDKLTLEIPGLYLTGSAFKGIGISDCIASSESVADDVVTFLKM